MTFKEQWVAALRSGLYKQGTGRLRDGDKYCCLGVACDLTAKAGISEWKGGGTYLDEEIVAPALIQEFLGIDEAGGMDRAKLVDFPELAVALGDRSFQLTALNDSGVPFTRIADVIEKLIPDTGVTLEKLSNDV